MHRSIAATAVSAAVVVALIADIPIRSLSLVPPPIASHYRVGRRGRHHRRHRAFPPDAATRPIAFFGTSSRATTVPSDVVDYSRIAIPSIRDPSRGEMDMAAHAAAAVDSSVIRLPSGTRVRLFYPSGTMDDDANDDNSTARASTNRSLEDSPVGGMGGGGDVTTTTLPLLISSHDNRGNMDSATSLFCNMASRGMIVASLEHTDGTASSTVLVDGSIIRYDEYRMTGRKQLIRRASELLEASRHLPDEIHRRSSHRGGTIVEVGHVMLGGHGIGGSSAVMAANGAPSSSCESSSDDPAGGGVLIRGIVLHDPMLGMGYGMLPPNGSRCRVPAICYVSDSREYANVRYGDVTMRVVGWRHANFIDETSFGPRWIMRSLSSLASAASGGAVGSSNPLDIHDQLSDSAFAFVTSGGDANCAGVTSGGLLEVLRNGDEGGRPASFVI